MTQNVVFLSFESPLDINSGAKIRDVQNVRLLAERHRIEALVFGETDERIPVPSVPNAHITTMPRIKESLFRRAIYPLRPYVVNGYCRRLEGRLRALYSAGSVLWVSRLSMAQYIPAARRMGYSVFLDAHNVESHLWISNIFERPGRSPLALLQRSYEYWIARQCRSLERRFAEMSDRVIVPSDVDRCRFLHIAPRARVAVVPSCVDVDGYAPVRERAQTGSTLLFTGTLHYGPNVDGLNWFRREVLPRLRAMFPDGIPFRIVVAGSRPPVTLIDQLARDDIDVVADPPSMLGVLERAAALFVPLRSGGGTRLKILEAMACALPVVSTSKGAEGLTFAPNRDLAIADDPGHFAKAIAALMSDPTARESMGQNAYEAVRMRYDWRCARPQMQELFGGLN